jgi:hypothetical protein
VSVAICFSVHVACVLCRWKIIVEVRTYLVRLDCDEDELDAYNRRTQQPTQQTATATTSNNNRQTNKSPSSEVSPSSNNPPSSPKRRGSASSKTISSSPPPLLPTSSHTATNASLLSSSSNVSVGGGKGINKDMIVDKLLRSDYVNNTADLFEICWRLEMDEADVLAAIEGHPAITAVRV